MHLVYSQVKTVLSNSSSYKTTLSDFIFIFFVENIFFHSSCSWNQHWQNISYASVDPAG